MYDLISIGGISIDVYFKGKALTYGNNRFQLAIGGKYLADQIHFSVGGGGANVAISAAKHNVCTAVYGIIGSNSFKMMIQQELETKNVDHHLCPIQADYVNISSILLNENGERTIINYVSPHLRLFESDLEIRKLLNTRFLFIGNLPDVSFTNRLHLLSQLKKSNIIIAANLGIKDCRRPLNQLKDFLAKIDILICNGHEFAEIVKAPYNDILFKENIVRHYIPELAKKIVIVTEGARGSYAYCDDLILHQKAYRPEVIVDTTGAGDGYTGTFIAEYIKTRKVALAMDRASHFAAKVLSSIGAN